ncbi:hypothetical protein [Serratia nevei]|uniref:hypothetical protein n=1 Tax=Serratia nevei TaxID=2703794 RepID=UPI00313B9C25
MKNNLVNQDIKTDKPLVMSYEALKAERDAQQKRADALAVENSNQRDWMNKCSELWDAGCDLENLLGMMPETPATDAAVAAIQAQGVEKFAKRCRDLSMQENRDVYVHWKLSGDRALKFADELREAK